MKVALYIYTESLENDVEYIVNNFKNRVIADGGVFEADSCCIDVVQSLGGSFNTYTTAKRIELYDDEKISITSSIQNISDISKVFTDYSQSFVIPASDNNNEIFRHWYENSLDNGFDQRIRYDGYIEIDTQTFRVGKWQLESATFKNNRVEDYKITFYGNLLSLTDKFKEDKLKDIETLNDYSFTYTSGLTVRDMITSTLDFDVNFPLISSERAWQYGSGTENIATVGGAIKYDELFPCIKVARIFDAIQSNYGLNFQGEFLNDLRFKKSFLWLKNGDAKRLIPQIAKSRIQFPSNVTNDFFSIDSLTDSVQSLAFSKTIGGNDISNAKFTLTINMGSVTGNTLIVYKNDRPYTTLNPSGSTFTFVINEALGIGDYKFFLSGVALTSSYTFTGVLNYYSFNGSTGNFVNTTLTSGSGVTNSFLDLAALTPDIKVTDFFTGILKMFNLTAFSEDGVNFTLEQLENWYYKGDIKDFSEYTIRNFDFERIKPYKKINFEYEKSESLSNRNFYNTNAREYGNLNYAFNNDGSDYTIKLPFENLMFQKFTGTNLQVGYALKPEITPYAPKPIILYHYQRQSGNLFFDTGAFTATNINTFNIFGQDFGDFFNGYNTLNWGLEYSTFFGNIINNTLFNNYYLAYLNNLYLLKSRMLKVSMRLPYLELLNLKLNDRIVIRDKRYIINSYTTDLITFESNFELIQDFRSINFNNSTLRQTDNTLKTEIFNTTSIEPLTWTIESDPEDFIALINNQDTYVEVGIKPNASGLERTAAITSNLNDRIIIVQDA